MISLIIEFEIITKINVISKSLCLRVDFIAPCPSRQNLIQTCDATLNNAGIENELKVEVWK